MGQWEKQTEVINKCCRTPWGSLFAHPELWGFPKACGRSFQGIALGDSLTATGVELSKAHWACLGNPAKATPDLSKAETSPQQCPISLGSALYPVVHNHLVPPLSQIQMELCQQFFILQGNESCSSPSLWEVDSLGLFYILSCHK